MEIALIIEKFILITVIFSVSLGVAAYSTLAERKIAGYLQDRVGPSRAVGAECFSACRWIEDVF